MEIKEPSQTAVGSIFSGTTLPIPKILVWAIASVCVFFSLFHIYTMWFSMLDPVLQRRICIYLLLVLGALTNPLGRKTWSDRLNKWFILDLIMVLLLVGSLVFNIIDFENMEDRYASNLADMVNGYLVIFLTLELTRRAVGWPLVIITLFFLLQCYLSPYLPGILFGPPVTPRRFVDILYLQTTGLFGSVASVMTSILVMFLIFVAFLLESGAIDRFLNVALSVAGRYRGGPAKVAVIASAFMGSVSGSAIANVSGTGSITIPMMKRLKYKVSYAAGIEAAASTGGQIMPPVMAAAAFIMAQFLGVSYGKVILWAFIPACAYFFCILMQVHFSACKYNLQGLRSEEVPPLKKSLVGVWPLVLPFVLLITLLLRGYGAGRCAMYALLAFFVCAMLSKAMRFSPAGVLICLEKGARMCIQVGIAIACVGILIGAILVSGLGDKVASLLISASGGSLLLAGIYTALIGVMLGMGVTTIPVYVTLILVVGPALLNMGANEISVHFMCLYYGIINCISPPVALAAFAAAAIADSKPMETAFQATKLGIVALCVPIVFLFSPEILLQGSAAQVFIAVLFLFIGIFHLAGSFEGYLLQKINTLQRLMLAVGSVACFWPGLLPKLVGLAPIATVYISSIYGTGKMRQYSENP